MTKSDQHELCGDAPHIEHHSFLMTALALMICLLSLLLTSAEADGTPVWAEKTVRVLDYSSPLWEGMVEDMVGEFNTMLPDAAPRLVYKRMQERSCDQLSNRSFNAAIVVCSIPTAPFVGMTGMWAGGATMVDTRIVLNDRRFDNVRFATNTVCHELMHAVTGIKDKYYRRPKTSCVWGDLPAPGRFDAAFAQKAYERFKRR